ncbi:MAG: hypothetical protein SFH39_12205 [Candidatus Magnetobacterium sp. LHC-1]|nr:hypothetical protein [Nitrospirota bacterium]
MDESLTSEQILEKYHTKKGREAGLYLAGLLSALTDIQQFNITVNVNFDPIAYSEIGFDLPITFEKIA